MKNFFKKTSEFIFSKQSGIFSSAILLSSMIILTSFSGFLRYRVLANFFPKEELDIFFASFRIPDLVFEILITGALTTSFIPIYLRYKDDKKLLSENISSIFNFILLFLIFFIIFFSIFIDKFIFFITPGYNFEKTQKIIQISRILLIGQLPFFILANFLTGLGQANKIFFLSSLGPIIYNLAIVFSVIFFNQLGLASAIYGVILGSIGLFLIQIPLFFKSNFHYQLILKKTPGLKDFLKMIIPRTLTVIIAQIDATIDLTLATFLGTGAYTVFYFAQHLQLLPVSVIGIALGQASLPYLSELFQEKKIEEFKKIIIDSVLNVFFLIMPISLFFIFARTPMVRLFFGGQRFDWQATNETAITLSYFAIGLSFHSIYYLLTRSFYAMMDSKTPFLIGFISIIINTLLSIFFVFFLRWPIWSLAISFSLSMIFNTSLLFFTLSKKIHGFDFKNLFLETSKIFISSFLSGFLSYFLMKLLDGLIFKTIFTINVFFLLATTFIFFFIFYLFFAWIFNVKEIYLFSKLILKAKEYQKKIIEVYTQYE